MGIIAETARKLAKEGNSIDKILDAIAMMEDGAKPAKRGRDGSPRLELQRVLDETHVQAILDYRQRMKAPLTGYTARKLAEEFEKCHDPNKAADYMMGRSWRGFDAGWMKDNGNGSYQGSDDARRGSRHEEQARAFERAAQSHAR